MFEGQGLAVRDLERSEEPSRLMVGVCCSLGVTSLLLPRALMVSVCLSTEEDLRSAWLARGLTLLALRGFTLLLLSLLLPPLLTTPLGNYYVHKRGLSGVRGVDI